MDTGMVPYDISRHHVKMLNVERMRWILHALGIKLVIYAMQSTISHFAYLLGTLSEYQIWIKIAKCN